MQIAGNIGSWWRARRTDAAVCVLIAGFFVLFFPQVVFGGKFLIAGDALFYSYPLRTVAWDMIRGGQLPLWTPYVLSGYPLLSMAQLGLGYPLTWGYLFLPGHWAEQVYVLAPFLLSPVFTYAYAREVGRSRLAALFAGLAFGYGGMMCSGIANSGLLTNSMLWLPLVLIPVDRAQRRSGGDGGGGGRFAPCLVAATAAYSMSVLNGHGQSFVYAGMLIVAYGLFLALFPVRDAATMSGGVAQRRDDTGQDRDEVAQRRSEAAPLLDEANAGRGWFAFDRWRPLFVAVGALGLSAGVAAFQILETMRAAQRSIRSALTLEMLGEGSFSFGKAAASLIAPLYHYIDVTTYMPPLALLLALVAIVTAWRIGKRQDARVFFWLAVAVAAWVLLLGSHTPFHQLVFRVPVLNGFRVPSRHAFEWTFALAVLAAYGWDALAALIRARRSNSSTGTTALSRRELSISLLALSAATVVGGCWWRATVWPQPPPESDWSTSLAESSYLLWKVCFVLLVGVAWWLAMRARASRGRTVILVAVIVLTCYVEQFAIISCWWGGRPFTAERFSVVSPVTRYLQTLPPAENRVYTRVGIFVEEFTSAPRFEGANLSALHGLHNVAGMEPLIFERYSRALGGVGADSVTPRAGFPGTVDLFQAKSHVLDLLNTTHVVSFSHLSFNIGQIIRHDDLNFAPADSSISLKPGQALAFAGGATEGDTLALVSLLSNSAGLEQGTAVASIRLTLSGESSATVVVERELRAGLDTAEWAHERADVRAHIRHALAPIFDTRQIDDGHGNSFASPHYLARISLGARARLEKVEITNTTRDASLNLLKATLSDSASGHSTPLILESSEWWEPIYQRDATLVMHNRRAQPRAWLVGAAEAVDSEEALRRIRGESATATAAAAEFDPRRTALMEVRPDELPALSGGELPPGSTARIAEYEPTRLVIETECAQASVLVVSEMIYPGWEATIDGAAARIDATDFILRGVALTAGAHRVEMRYRAPAARTGALISLISLILLGGLLIHARRRRHS